MRNQTVIRLSADAMERLFPEGTDARVELQQAVLNEVVGRHIKVSIDDQLQHLARAIAKEVIVRTDVESIVAGAFSRQYGWSKDPFVVTEAGGMAEAIGKRLHATLRQQQSDLIGELAEKAITDSTEQLEQRIDELVARKFDNLQKTLVHDRVNKALQAAYDSLDAALSGESREA